MKQIIRKGIKDIIVDDVPDPVVSPHHVLIRPVYSLISSGTETASIHSEGLLKEVADNPSHIRKILAAMKTNGPVATVREVLAKFSEYAALGYSGAGDSGRQARDGGRSRNRPARRVWRRRHRSRRDDSHRPESGSASARCSFVRACVLRHARQHRNERHAHPGVGLGDRVAVIGLGLVGQLVAQLARLQGAVVIATDLKAERLDLAAKLGAQYPISGGTALAQEVGAVTDGKGADCVIVAAAAKSAGPCQQALAICRDRGRIVVVGAVEMSFPWNDMYLKEIQLFMSRAYGPGSYDPAYEKEGHDYPFGYVRWTENRNMEEFLRLAGAGQVQLQPLITHQFALEEGPKAYDTIMDPGSKSLAVLLRYNVDGEANSAAEFRPQRVVSIASKPLEKEQLGVALLGSGNLARWAHLPNLKKYPHAALRAVHSASGARAKSIGIRFGAARCTTVYDEIYQDPEIDVVIIVSRNQHHAPQALAALQAGKHVYVEKPMALSEDECRALHRAVQESGKQLTVGFNRRFAPLYKPLKEHLTRRSSPAVISCRVNSPGISGSYWMADPAIGGAILGEACHFVDLMYWMLDAEPVSVSAYSLPTGKREPIGENNLVASFRFSDGSIGNLTYCTVGSKTSGGERVEVFTEGLGMASENFKKLSVQGGLRRTRSTMFAEKGYQAQLHGFLDGIRQGKPPEVTVRDGARATLGCLRMLESARDGMPREIGLDALLS